MVSKCVCTALTACARSTHTGTHAVYINLYCSSIYAMYSIQPYKQKTRAFLHVYNRDILFLQKHYTLPYEHTRTLAQ